MNKTIEYLNEKFPKGKSKLRGEAMVLLALAIQEKEISKILSYKTLSKRYSFALKRNEELENENRKLKEVLGTIK